jgi:hypothetical protein
MINVTRIPGLPHGRLVDLRLGFALMRDRRVPLRSKLLAALMGLGITGIVEFLELPIEGLLSVLLPVLGAAGDVVVDGVEIVAGPLLLANLLLPFVAPRDVVEIVRAERSGTTGGKGRVIDV